jgi:AcrR family transcriptional regulator
VTTKKALVRKLPTHERGRKRVEAILDAAALLFADQGFDAVTMETIAARSETAIGSLYQFFPSKRSVFEAIAERSLARSRATFELLAGATASMPWPELVDAMVDGFALLHAADPAFRAVITNFQLYGLYAEADTALHALIVEQIATRMKDVAPQLTSARRALVSEMVVSTVASLLFLSQRHPPKIARGMREETKRLVRSYLEGVISA